MDHTKDLPARRPDTAAQGKPPATPPERPGPSGPNNVHRPDPAPDDPFQPPCEQDGVLGPPETNLRPHCQCSTHEPPTGHVRPDRRTWTSPRRHNDDDKPAWLLLRKEVIQPHLPVRLPCYDLVLITDPTFDGSPHKGWATGFGCYRLS
jgi:hypothetical protein